MRNSQFETDILLLSSPQNLRYFTGFTGGEGYAVITKNTAYLFVDGRYTQQAKLEAINFDVVDVSKNSNTLQNTLQKGAIGYEDEYLSVASFNRIFKDTTRVVPYSKKLLDIRSIKTKKEIEEITKAADIANGVFHDILNIIRPGVTERELALEIDYRLRKKGGEASAFETIVLSGVRGSMPHGKPSDKPIAYGELVTMDFGCVVMGYCSDMTRTVAVGEIDDEQRRIYDIVLKAQQNALNNIRAGTESAQIDNAARSIIENEGLGQYFNHSLGHGVGLNIHEEPRLSQKSTAVLVENMVVTVEPGIYIPDFCGVRIEDMVCITTDGYENFTKCPKDLIVL